MLTSEKHHYELVSKKSAKIAGGKKFKYTLDKKKLFILLLKAQFLLSLHFSSNVNIFYYLKNNLYLQILVITFIT
jgi:hypothetical protein